MVTLQEQLSGVITGSTGGLMVALVGVVFGSSVEVLSDCGTAVVRDDADTATGEAVPGKQDGCEVFRVTTVILFFLYT